MALPQLPSIEPKKTNKPAKKKKEKLVPKHNWGVPLSTPTRHVNEFSTTGWNGGFNLDLILSEAIEAGASDVHVTPNERIFFSILGRTGAEPQYGIPSADVMFDFGKSLMNSQQYTEYVKSRNFQFAYVIYHGPYQGTRFRVSIGKTNGSHFLVFRHITDRIPTTEEVQMEQEVLDWTETKNGLILICGATGSGKSTSLAAILRKIQLEREEKIITIENPIEYSYPTDGKSLVVQREIGDDVVTFSDGLDSAMRQAPDIILIGEVRNNLEVSELIRAGETGHLSFSTMHTNSVATTINRILSLYTGNERTRILNTLSDTLVGICNQVLVLSADGESRFAVREILSNNDEIRDLIINGDVRGIRKYQKDRESTMEFKLAQAYLDGKCNRKEARKHAPYPDEFDKAEEILRAKK